MRITLESDYALRILTELAEHNDVVDANTLSEATSVTIRFTLKILNKLVKNGFVSSYKGARGGYKLKLPKEEITLKSVIELIDGPIVIARCLETSEACSLNKDKTSCTYHHIFNTISLDVAKKLEAITIADVINRRFSLI
jgi:Rrf2 family protein